MTEKKIDATEFYHKVVQGTEYYEEITLSHSEGWELEGVEMHIVDKEALMDFIAALPEEMLEEVEEAEGLDEEEATAEELGSITQGVNAETIRAFEDICKESLEHPELLDEEMHGIIDNLSFEVLFELGTEIVNMSFERDGDVKDFAGRD